ncbi:Uu.00g036860.m01.CDS01 [Anthostomella pinea]|uniref:Uu.00g036860.m01.CDS01 n=1 Tax=Anthostomella pinea TaxID=933095 RepID=A0AAI8V9M1_9PEZI|nr:Uu.00g036860.m01.CDS01 [Anthostomella pinea]
MEQPFSTSKVTVEYFDPHGVFKLLAPGLVPRLPLRNLHWQSHAGPLRSIDTLHVELLAAGDKSSTTSPLSSPPVLPQRPENDGFQTQIGAPATPLSIAVEQTSHRKSLPTRRHQIPGLRRTPYLKVLLVRCDDNDTYKGHVRQEIRDWLKENTPPSSTKKVNTAENHDAFEWLIVHVVIPNTVAATQPRKSDSGSGTDKTSAASRWRPGSSTLLEKLRSDFNTSSKSGTDRIAQIRIGVNDVPYDILPRVVPAVPSGYTETDQETENSWTDLLSKFRGLILSSFDLRVSQYEEDIKEKDAQRALPGWNFCTFFILKEGLARGFESVGLVEDALVGYDELSVGLDMIQDQPLGESGSAANALLGYTEELKQIALQAKAAVAVTETEEDELVDLQSSQAASAQSKDAYDDIPISSNKKPYRDMIVANNVSVFDFRCYIFARQIALLLRLGNAWSTREELLAKLREQQESVLHGVAPRAPPPKHKENVLEELPMLAEICRRTLEFIPSVSQVMRRDVLSALSEMSNTGESDAATIQDDPLVREVVDNLVASFAFSIAQQILAQTSTKALPIPPSTLASPDGHEPKAAIPEPKTMMHPARTSSLSVRRGGAGGTRPPPSPNAFPGRRMSLPDHEGTQSTYLKVGLEELAARRAELYALSRNILEERGKKRGWNDGWANVPVIGESTMVDMVEIDLGEEEGSPGGEDAAPGRHEPVVFLSGIDSRLLKTALDNSGDFYRLYEILTDKALRHYTVANHTHSIQASMADLAVLKYHLGDYGSAASYFWRTTPFFGESGWSLLELSMLVMYSKCLKQLERKDEYVKVLLKLLSKAAAAERDRQLAKSSFRIGKKQQADYPEGEAIKGFLHDLLVEAKALPNAVRMPLSNFFSSVEVDGPPEYHLGRDSVSINLKVSSLLVDDLKLESAKLRIVNTTARLQREIWLEQEGPITIRTGSSKLKLISNAAIPGSYEIDKIDLIASNLCFHYERETGYPLDRASSILKSPYVSVYHQADALDAKLHASKHIQLDQSNTVDIELDTGWNEVISAEVRVKAAAGGLRLLTSEAQCLHSSIKFCRPPEGGLFCFDSIPPRTTIRARFPYTVEQETPNVAVRIEVSYVTEHGTFVFSKTPTIHTGLALGVNVQDVFKHSALFSRFTVSTASPSPLRLFKSELVASDIFESDYGVPPAQSVVIFPRQPASLLYKTIRKADARAHPKASKMMYLKLQYSILHDDIESLVEDSLVKALHDTPLRRYSRLLTSTVLPRVRSDLTGLELERASLLGSVSTAFLTTVNWARSFAGVGQSSDGVNISDILGAFLQKWLAETPALVLPTSQPAEPTSILIPVDIPPVTIVHTADIRLQPPPSPVSFLDAATPTVCTHQLLPATLHLKWTRIWDTATPPSDQKDLEFSYELSAPQDTWLLGGRRKGHFVIPAPSGAVGNGNGHSSTAETEAEIPILLIPLREGLLPYPGVDIREVRTDVGPASGGQTPIEGPAAAPIGAGGVMAQFETDYRNMAETVRVIADRARVTLSLDASGPGGGPLVLDVERRALEGRVVA